MTLNTAIKRAIEKYEDLCNDADELEIMADNKKAEAEEMLGKIIRQYRNDNGIGLREFARKLKISAPFLSDIERGRRSMSDDNYFKIRGIIK